MKNIIIVSILIISLFALIIYGKVYIKRKAEAKYEILINKQDKKINSLNKQIDLYKDLLREYNLTLTEMNEIIRDYADASKYYILQQKNNMEKYKNE